MKIHSLNLSNLTIFRHNIYYSLLYSITLNFWYIFYHWQISNFTKITTYLAKHNLILPAFFLNDTFYTFFFLLRMMVVQGFFARDNIQQLKDKNSTGSSTFGDKQSTEYIFCAKKRKKRKIKRNEGNKNRSEIKQINQCDGCNFIGSI